MSEIMTAPITYDEIGGDRLVEGCGWCSKAFGHGYPATLVIDGAPDGVRVVHDQCVEGLKRRARIAEQIATLQSLVVRFTEAQAALEAETEREPIEPGSQYFYDRDDAGVAVAENVGALLELLKAEGLGPEAAPEAVVVEAEAEAPRRD